MAPRVFGVSEQPRIGDCNTDDRPVTVVVDSHVEVDLSGYAYDFHLNEARLGMVCVFAFPCAVAALSSCDDHCGDRGAGHGEGGEPVSETA